MKVLMRRQRQGRKKRIAGGVLVPALLLSLLSPAILAQGVETTTQAEAVTETAEAAREEGSSAEALWTDGSALVLNVGTVLSAEAADSALAEAIDARGEEESLAGMMAALEAEESLAGMMAALEAEESLADGMAALEVEESLTQEGVSATTEDVLVDDEADDAEVDYPTYSLTLEYDDRFSLADYAEADLADYRIVSIETDEVISYQVSGGENTGILDEAVVTANGETGLVATGVGTATVRLEKEETGTALLLQVEVEPATLSLLLLGGQSNGEGTCSTATGAHPEDSVLCAEGEVYSTYLPSSASRGASVTGISGMSACTTKNVSSFVAGSLTGTSSLAGSTLTYPLTALTEAGSGKTGPDSGLAYTWNQLSGEKVWVINAAWSATTISQWIPGETAYERALAAYQAAMTTATAEVAAGHYTLGHTLLFWQQGETDRATTATEYLAGFRSMLSGFDEAGLGIEYVGIIMVRASTGDYTTTDELYLTGPRLAQYLLANSQEDDRVYVVSNANEEWITDSGVKSYFSAAYGSRLTYPLRESATISAIPQTVAEIHSDIHYSQVGHNENGITAAGTMYTIVTGASASSATVTWVNRDGTSLSQSPVVGVSSSVSALLIPVVSPLSASKQVTVSLSGTAFAYNSLLAVASAEGSGTGTLVAEVQSATARVSLSTAVPALKTIKATANGVTVSWDSLSGAKGYAVYRKEAGGSWSLLGTTTSTSYKDTTALDNGKTYYYTVRASRTSLTKALKHKYSSIYWTGYDTTGIKLVYLAIPEPETVSRTTSGLTVSWTAVSGAEGYWIYRKESGGSWILLGTATSASYTDTTAETGVLYTYTVRAYKGKAALAEANTYLARYWSGYSSSGIQACLMETPALKTATAAATGTKLSWSTVTGATGYVVYRKESGGSWKQIGRTTSASFTDTEALTSGTTYTYTVRAYRGSWTEAKANKYQRLYWSSYDSTGVTSVYLATPTLKTVTSVSGGLKVSWSKVSSAGGYAVYRKTSGGSWTFIGSTTSTSYTDTTAKKGTTYYYTVRPCRGSLTTALANKYKAAYWGGYNKTGIKGKR